MNEAEELEELQATRPDWKHTCEVCGATPILPCTGLCGLCTFGEAETIKSGWWDEESEERYQELIKRK